MDDIGRSSESPEFVPSPVAIVFCSHNAASPNTHNGVLTSQRRPWLGLSDGESRKCTGSGNVPENMGLASDVYA